MSIHEIIDLTYLNQTHSSMLNRIAHNVNVPTVKETLTLLLNISFRPT